MGNSFQSCHRTERKYPLCRKHPINLETWARRHRESFSCSKILAFKTSYSHADPPRRYLHRQKMGNPFRHDHRKARRFQQTTVLGNCQTITLQESSEGKLHVGPFVLQEILTISVSSFIASFLKCSTLISRFQIPTIFR